MITSKSKKLFTNLILGSAFSLVVGSTAMAETKELALDPFHAFVSWDASHFGFSTATGLFPLASGTLVLDEKNLDNSKVNVVIDLNKLSTGNPMFDQHLKSGMFFDVDEHPEAKFVSTKVVRLKDKHGKLTNEALIYGNLSLHGCVGPIVIKAKFVKKGVNPYNKKEDYAFDGTTVVKRSAYGMKNMIDMGISDDIKIRISAEFNPADAPKE